VYQRLATYLLCTALSALMGCGVYTASKGRVDDNLKRVSVEYLENLTAEPSLGVDLAEAITLAIQTDNTLKYVDATDADAIISGKVTRYALKEVGARQDLTITEYQVQIAVFLTMTVTSTGETMFAKRRFTGTGNYELNDDLSNEETARSEAAVEIVRDILALVVEDW